MLAEWRRQWRDAGFSVQGWGWLEGDPVAEAKLAVDLCKRYALDAYIANAEVAYEWSGVPATDGFWKSRMFVAEFRRLAPNLPLALSCIGYGDGGRPIDYRVWLEAEAVVMPQAYPNHDGYDLDACMAATLAAGVPRERIVPTLGTWRGKFGRYPMDQYVTQLRRAGTLGVNLFLLESTPDDELKLLAEAIRAGAARS